MFLRGVRSISDKIVVSGGMAGDGAKFKDSYVLSNNGVISKGAVGVSIDSDELTIQNRYSFNWQEIGKSLYVTRAQNNRVYEIDNLPAVDVYTKYLGKEIADLLPAVGIEFPLILNRYGIKVARAVLGKEEDGSLIFAGNISEGDEVHFGYGNSTEILRKSDEMKEILSDEAIESIFVYSCMARRRFLEESISAELTPLAKIAPTVGFFTYGEFFTATQCELLNQTMTVLAMSENSIVDKREFHDSLNQKNLAELNVTHRALSHLVAETSKELKELNEHLEEKVAQKTKKLKEKVAELEEASKVKSEFLAGMSHEIRTPLNAMLGFVDLLKADETDRERLKRFSIIKKSGATLLTIINDILDFSKLESGKMLLEKKKFALKKPFKDIAQLFEGQAKEKGVELEVIFDHSLPRFFVGDMIRIKQIASNFLSNALKFTDKGGKVIMNISYDTRNESLEFNVEDNGVGIDEKNLKKIFESFTQEDASTTRRFGGTGLGLSISKALVDSMHGKINVRSRLGEGSKFCFSLPSLNIDETEIEKPLFSEEVDISKPLEAKVLLVEDNKTNQMLMNIILDDLGLDVDLAENGIEAVEAFENQKYDLILMDENMPKMNGIEATSKILDIEEAKGLKHTPIIALTANALSTDRARFLNAGMDEFVSKPIDHEYFLKVLHSFL